MFSVTMLLLHPGPQRARLHVKEKNPLDRQTDRQTDCPAHSAPCFRFSCTVPLVSGSAALGWIHCQEERRASPKHVARREDVPAQSMLQGGKTCRPKACCKEGRLAGPKHVARREDMHAQSMLQVGKTCRPKACCNGGRHAGPKHVARREDVPAQSMLQGGKTCMPKACCKQGRLASPKHVARREDMHAQSMLQGGKIRTPKAVFLSELHGGKCNQE